MYHEQFPRIAFDKVKHKMWLLLEMGLVAIHNIGDLTAKLGRQTSLTDIRSISFHRWVIPHGNIRTHK